MKCPICKKNIPDNSLKCPYCKTRTGLLCKNCNTINSISSLSCKNCGKELLKICPHCKSVNFPKSTKCRKCGTVFYATNISDKNASDVATVNTSDNNLLLPEQAYKKLTTDFKDKDKKIFGITGEKGIGKTTLLDSLINNLKQNDYQWCRATCTQLTQLSTGGVIKSMLLNLFNLPIYYSNNDELKNDAVKFFSKEFRFLKTTDIMEFFNFLYSSKDGNYEDIIINKKKIYDILDRIFDALYRTGKFVFVIEDFDYIDGFSVEFFAKFINQKEHWKNLKLILTYEEHTPVSGIFPVDNKYINSYSDIALSKITKDEYTFDNDVKQNGLYITDREMNVIFQKSNGNPAYIQQAIAYCYDCQIADKAFLMEYTFPKLVKARLETLRKIHQEAYRVICGAVVLGEKINIALLKEILGYKADDFSKILQYLEKTKYIKFISETTYEFYNVYLWETILKTIENDNVYQDVNIKIGKAISLFSLNTTATMTIISHNLREHRMAFDIWTKNTRLAAYIGDVNLYVISQKQCLALLNEFNESETTNIRYNISEKLGKILTEYDPEEAMEYLPDAISNARTLNDETKEIELLGYLALCCRKTYNYFGDIECVDNILKKINQSQDIEAAMIKTIKLPSLINIGNCGEAINLIDNDILPIINKYLVKPRLDMTIPLGFLYDTWLKVYLYLAHALALQGTDRVFEVLTNLFDIIDRHKINDEELMCRAKLIMSYANIMKGNFKTAYEVLSDVSNKLATEDVEKINTEYAQITNNYNLINCVTKFALKSYDKIQEFLAESVIFASDTGDDFSKNIYKIFLGKMFCDMKQAKKALSIYNEQITYFSEKKNAIGSLLTWYYIAEANLIMELPRQALDIANQALEIAKNPKIDNIYIATMLKILLAKINIELSDFESANMYLDSSLKVAQKYSMNDLLTKIYLIYGQYYYNMGMTPSQRQNEYLSGAVKMLDKAMEIIISVTKNNYVKESIVTTQNSIKEFCMQNNIIL